MNKERLQLLRKTIVDNKDRFYYARWATPLDDLTGEGISRIAPEINSLSVSATALQLIENKSLCGCVGGFTIALFSVEADHEFMTTDIKKYLELTDEEVSFLCFGRGMFGFDSLEPIHKATVEDALKRIDYLINER